MTHGLSAKVALSPAAPGSLSAILLLALFLLLLTAGAVNGQAVQPATIETSSFDPEVTDLFTHQMTLSEIKSYNPAPDKIFAAGTTATQFISLTYSQRRKSFR